jgi:phage terminase large subunit
MLNRTKFKDFRSYSSIAIEQRITAQILKKRIFNNLATPKLKVLYEPHRYKILYGGRGSGKSYGVAEAIIYYALVYNINILCCRHIQASISDSSKSTIETMIRQYGFTSLFTIKRDEIESNLTGARIIFRGLYRNQDSLKSIPNLYIAWVEEADTLTEETYNILYPTLREKNSEIWMTFNPQSETDFVSRQYLLPSSPPVRGCIININWNDNKYFKDTAMYDEMLLDKETDYDKYLHIWEGQFIKKGSDFIISSELARNAISRPVLKEKTIKTAGFDVADGGDRSVLVIRTGNRIEKSDIHIWRNKTTDIVWRDVANICMNSGVDVLVVDHVGVGTGPFNELNRLIGNTINVIKFRGGDTPKDDRYNNINSECWFTASEWLQTGQIPDNDELIKDLISVKYTYNNIGSKLCRESKSDIKKRLNASPDIADAFIMTFYHKAIPKITKSVDLSKYVEDNSWM